MTSTVNQTSGDSRRTRSSTSRDSTLQVLLTGETLPLFYAGTGTSASESNRREMGEYLHTAAVCYLEPLDNFSLNQSIDADMYVEAALCGDAIVHHFLTTSVGVVPGNTEPNTIRQAYALPDRDKWRDSVDVELDLNSYRSSSVYTASRITMDHHVGLCKSSVVNVRTGVSSTTKSSTTTQGE